MKFMGVSVARRLTRLASFQGPQAPTLRNANIYHNFNVRVPERGSLGTRLK